MVNANLKTREQEILEVDILCFLEYVRNEELAIIAYLSQGSPRRIDVKKNFDYTVENNRIKICNKDEKESAFELDYRQYDFIFWKDEFLRFDHNEDFITVKIAPAINICKEEDAQCTKIKKIVL